MKGFFAQFIVSAMAIALMPSMAQAQVSVSDINSPEMIRLKSSHVGLYNNIVANDQFYNLHTANVYSKPGIKACPANYLRLSQQHRAAKLNMLRLYAGGNDHLKDIVEPIIKKAIAPINLPAAEGNKTHLVSVYKATSADKSIIVDLTGSGETTLVLSSYESVTWRIQLAPGVKIKKVLLLSYAPSRVEGLHRNFIEERRYISSVSDSISAGGMLKNMMIDEVNSGLACSDLVLYQMRGESNGRAKYSLSVK